MVAAACGKPFARFPFRSKFSFNFKKKKTVQFCPVSLTHAMTGMVTWRLVAYYLFAYVLYSATGMWFYGPSGFLELWKRENPTTTAAGKMDHTSKAFMVLVVGWPSFAFWDSLTLWSPDGLCRVRRLCVLHRLRLQHDTAARRRPLVDLWQLGHPEHPATPDQRSVCQQGLAIRSLMIFSPPRADAHRTGPLAPLRGSLPVHVDHASRPVPVVIRWFNVFCVFRSVYDSIPSMDFWFFS